MAVKDPLVKFCYAGIVGTTILANYVEIPVYAHMMIMTMLIIYAGSALSVKDNAEKAEQGMEHMSSKDAYMFPLIGSAFLFSLYLVFKFVPKEYVTFIIKGYFSIFGVLVLASSIHRLLSMLIPAQTFASMDKELFRFHIPYFSNPPAAAVAPSTTADSAKPKGAAATASAHAPAAVAQAADPTATIISLLDIGCYIISTAVGVWYLKENHWSANNIFGAAFSLQGIEFLSLGSFFNGMVLLCGLFIYDIFWVFGTDVMVTVAKSFDGPIKLLFPRQLGAQGPSMLGLGDIVIPGVFLALLLRYDHHLAQKRAVEGHVVSKWYFWHGMVGYFVGLTTTVLVMYQFQAAQPALLYLVPTCLGAAVIAAARQGKVMDLYRFEEAEVTAADKPKAS